MLERLSVPRRPFDFEDYIDILRRNIRWIIAPAFAGLVISTVVAYFLPDTYVSMALLRIVPQQISSSLVQNVNSQEIVDHINGMAQSIESRNTLTNLINTHGLYKYEHQPMEDIINKMRTDIGIRPLMGVADVSGKSLPAMQVSFSYRDSRVAQQVCEDLVSRFINQSTQDTLENQLATNQFLNDEAERAKHELDLAEKKLTDFQTQNAGRLPEELQTNMSEMNALGQRLSSLNESASRNTEQRMLLENELHAAKDRLNSIKVITPQTQAQNAKVTDLDHRIETVENNIASMKDHWTDDYPDLQAAKEELASLKRQREEALKEKPPKADGAPENPAVLRERLDATAQIEQIQTLLRTNAIESQRINADLQSVNAALRSYQGRVEGIAPGTTQYNDLVRERNVAQAKYEDMDARRQKSTVSMDLERRKQGETLELLDPASLPTSPTAPKRAMIIPIGAFAGLVLGIIIVAVREVKDTSLKNLKDARLYTQLSILGSIPLLENDMVVQRRKQIMWIGWASGTLAGFFVMAASVVHYYLNKG